MVSSNELVEMHLEEGLMHLTEEGSIIMKGPYRRFGGDFHQPRKKPGRAPGDVAGHNADIHFGLPWRVDKPTRALRREFLKAIERLEPDIKRECGCGVLESLHSEVFTYFGNDQGAPLCRQAILEEVDAAAKHRGDLTEYGRAFFDWMQRWNLLENWIVEVATATMQRWANEPAGEILEWELFEETSRVTLDSFNFADHGLPKNVRYDPTRDERALIEAKVKRVFDEFTEFLNEQERIAKDRARNSGREIAKTPQTRQPEQFTWLIRYQVFGESDEKIAYDFGFAHQPEYIDKVPDGDVSSESVRKSRERLAKHLGLRLRTRRT